MGLVHHTDAERYRHGSLGHSFARPEYGFDSLHDKHTGINATVLLTFSAFSLNRCVSIKVFPCLPL